MKMANDLYPLWDDKAALPAAGKVPFLDSVTHTMVHRAIPGEFQFMHESSVTVHEGELIVSFANDPRDENSAEGVTRARRSRDFGRTWTPPEMVAPGVGGRECDNHALLHSHDSVLRAYAARWAGGLHADGRWYPLPSMRAVQFVWDAGTGAWRETGVTIPSFLTMHGPQRLRNGGWIIAGEFGFETPAVAICADDRFETWTTVPILGPKGLKFPEPTIIVDDDRLVAIIRNELVFGPPQTQALVSESFDHGKTWSMARLANLPMVNSKPFGGILSTGQRFLVSNYPDPWSRRGCLTIAVGRPGEKKFSMLRTIRQGIPPVQLAGSCKEPQWSYPYAIEHDGALYVTYSVSKEDCAMSIIPLAALRF
jgi:hypothetical protein